MWKQNHMHMWHMCETEQVKCLQSHVTFLCRYWQQFTLIWTWSSTWEFYMTILSFSKDRVPVRYQNLFFFSFFVCPFCSFVFPTNGGVGVRGWDRLKNRRRKKHTRNSWRPQGLAKSTACITFLWLALFITVLPFTQFFSTMINLCCELGKRFSYSVRLTYWSHFRLNEKLTWQHIPNERFSLVIKINDTAWFVTVLCL